MGLEEFHYILEAASVSQIIQAQENLFKNCVPVFKRYFLSDAAAQRPLLPDERGAVSYIQQPPLDGNAVAVWIYAVGGAAVEYEADTTIVRDSDGVEHIWTAGICAPGRNSEEQTRGILEGYEAYLAGRELKIEDDCVRTWFHVSDIDDNYSGMVKARRENFAANGLVAETHYIASTGIAGKSAVPGAMVQMDAYCVRGLEKCSQAYLYAPTHLNPTYEYGVTFERGVRLDYSGRRHILISGTASIDNKGNVLHTGDVTAQTRRMIENVDVLLKEGGMKDWSGVVQAIVYLRNASDYAKVEPLLAQRLGSTPYVITLAPVCRPDWLIEMECIAIL